MRERKKKAVIAICFYRVTVHLYPIKRGLCGANECTCFLLVRQFKSESEHECIRIWFFSLSNKHNPRNIRSEKLKMFMLWITVIADLKSNQLIHNQLIYCVILMDFVSLRSGVSGVRSYVWLPFDRKEIMKSRLFIKMFKQMPFLVITSQYIWFHIAVYAYDVITSNMD